MKSKISPNLGERLNVEIFDPTEIGLILAGNLGGFSIFEVFDT